MEVTKLSVFFPAFNEEDNIEHTLLQALTVLKKLKLENFELIVVNDGSSDETASIVSGLSKKESRIRLVNHKKNLGYGNALKTGFKEAKYPWVAFADSDGQFDFAEISKLLDKTEEADFILGYRLKRADSKARIIGTAAWNIAAKILLGLPARDYSCGFKLIKKESFEKILPLTTGEKVTQIEMLVKAKRAGFKIVEVGVHHFPRKFGNQTGANINVILKSYLDLLRLWWKLLNKKEFAIIMGILGLAALLRFWRIGEYMTFLGDEGRDALVIKRILVEHHFPLLGPATSVGNMYLGPLYYYMMAIPMAIIWLNPIAAAGMNAIVGLATIWLIYYLGSRWFGFWAGALSAFLYSISPVTIYYSRSSWNPNPAPFFALLSIIGLYKLHKTGNFYWFILTGGALAFAIQMHYLALILAPIVSILWLYEILLDKRNKLKRVNITKGTIISIALFLFLMSPLVIFDFRHNFMNFHAVSTFFTNRETTVNVNPLHSLDRMPPIFIHSLVGRYIAGDMLWSNWLVSILVLMPLVIVLWKKIKGEALKWSNLTLGLWLFIGVAGLSLYKQTVYDHYLGFLNPVPYLLLGYFVFLKKHWINIGLVGLVLVLTVINLQKSPLLSPPNKQLERTQEVAKLVIEQSGGRPFNFALIAKSNYDAAYQYYLEVYDHKPKQVPFEITDQLFVVCEDPICDPVNNAKTEISHFGWSKVVSEQQFMGVKVYKLEHNPAEGKL